jgi:hypothetical protein
MRAKRTLLPGQQGTKNLLYQHGSELVCIRYRYEAERLLQFTTVPLDRGISLPSIAVLARIVSTDVGGLRTGGREVEV